MSAPSIANCMFLRIRSKSLAKCFFARSMRSCHCLTSAVRAAVTSFSSFDGSGADGDAAAGEGSISSAVVIGASTIPLRPSLYSPAQP